MMKDDTNLRINKVIIAAAAAVLALDLVGKTIGLGHTFTLVMKWLTTCFYPIVAGYVFLFARTFQTSDIAFFNKPKLEAKLLFAIKYIFTGAGILLLPSCLNYWQEFPPVLLSTLQATVIVFFPLAIILLVVIALKSVPAARKANEE